MLSTNPTILGIGRRIADQIVGTGIRALSLIAILLFLQEETATAKGGGIKDIRGDDLGCAVVAFQRHKKDYPEADLTHFVVQLRPRQKEVEVIFLPDPVPGSTLMGGKTEFGEEVHYVISKASHTVLKVTYGR
jgi:hypothetical protein